MLRNEIEKVNEEEADKIVKLEKVDKLEDTLLGKKKLRLANILEAASSKKLNSHINPPKEKNKSDEDSDEESEKEMEKYKNLISGKINLKNVFNNLKEESKINNKTKQENSSSIINKNPENKNPSQNISQKLLNLLPAPKKKISDNFNILNINFSKKKLAHKNFFEIGDKFRELANPDSEILQVDSMTSVNNINNLHNNINTYSINIDDQVDKNWELKYMRNLEVEEEAEADRAQHAAPTKEQTSKNHIKALIADHNKAKAIKQTEHEATNSKYGKISTKNKYGW